MTATTSLLAERRHVLHWDVETRSTLNLKKVGAVRYAGEPNTDVWCVAYSVDDIPVQLWLPGQPVPEEFQTAAREPDWVIVAHNDSFERTIAEQILGPRYGWPIVPIEKHRCTQAMSYAAALPPALKNVAEVLELKNRKDNAGAALMRQMARPRKPRAGEDPEGIYWHDDPEKLKRLYEYCKQDVEVERELYHRLPPLTDSEQVLWVLDAAINSRGFYTEGPLLDAASRIAAAANEITQKELAEITAGALTSTNQTEVLQAWLAEHGCEVEDVQKTTLRHALRRKGLDPVVRRVIELRLGAAHAAATKVEALLAWRNADGRVRGTIQFHGAHTGRWTSYGPQVQNFKRDTDGIEAKVAAISTGDLEHVAKLYPAPLEAVGDIARSMICAAPGHRFLVGDFSGVESRVLAWVSGQQSKIDQWAKFDRTGDPKDEPYYMIGRGCGRPEESARSIGKTADLAFGFAGGPGAWDRLAPKDDTSTEDDKRRYQQAWRGLHFKTTQFWATLTRACIQAVRKPGTEFTCRTLKVVYDGGIFLRITLPSGRVLSYPFPRLGTGKFGDTVVIFKEVDDRKKWADCNYGKGAWSGIWVENVVQALARDLEAAAMQRLEAAGYPVVLHVHDEIVVEAPDGFGSVEEFQALITALPDWAVGLPIAAKVRNGPRFSKSDKSEAPAPAKSEIIQEVIKSENSPTPAPPLAPVEPPQEDTVEETAPVESLDKIPFVIFPGLTLAAIAAAQTCEPEVVEDSPEPVAEPQSTTTANTDTDPERGPYIYRDQRGNPHAKVVRTPGGKSRFTQQHWTGKAWQAGMADRKLPYRLPELLAADPADWICICEGEKDCVNVAKLGFTSTTNPNGAKGWNKANLVPYFALFTRIAIFEDNDEPGRERTKRIVQSLRMLHPVPEIRIVSFPELPEGGDVSDWLAQDRGRGRAELLARVEAVEPTGAGQLDSLRVSTITMQAYDWLWPDRFALGEIGLVVGMPDEGKGQMLAYIAGRVTNGLEWPNGEGRAPQGNVVLLTAEDDISKTVKPRLVAAGADVDRIEIIRMVHEHNSKRMFSLISDLEQLRAKILEIGNVKLVEIDPVSAYLGLGKVDSYRTSDVRAILGPLKDMAEELGVAIVGIMHFNKKIDITNVLLRVSDSLAFVAAPRHVFGVIDDADNGRKLVVRAKNNLADAEQKRKALAFRFDIKNVGVDPRNNTPIRAPFIVWDSGYVDVTATEALSAAADNKSPGAKDKAKNLLLDILAGGAQVSSEDIADFAKAQGMSVKTLRRAGDELGVVVEKDRSTQEGKWFWKMPVVES